MKATRDDVLLRDEVDVLLRGKVDEPGSGRFVVMGVLLKAETAADQTSGARASRDAP
jgi:hypothetical protein